MSQRVISNFNTTATLIKYLKDYPNMLRPGMILNVKVTIKR